MTISIKGYMAWSVLSFLWGISVQNEGEDGE